MLVIGRRTLLKGTIAGLTLAALPRIRLAHAQATEAEAISELAAMKAAATEYLAANGGRETLPTTRVDLARQAGDFALIYQYPSPGTGEIGQVLIAKQNGQWTGLTYGGIFPDEESRHGAPDALFTTPPYFSLEALGEPLWDPSVRQSYQGHDFSFEFPPDASLDLESELAGEHAIAIVGEDYRIDLQLTELVADPLLDNWAHDLLQNGLWPAGGLEAEPSLIAFSADFGVNNVFMVERPYALGVVRDFLVAPKVGGRVVLVRTEVPNRPVIAIYPPPPDVQGQAVYALLDTLRIDSEPAAEIGRYVDTAAGFSISYPGDWRPSGYATNSGFTITSADGTTEVWVTAQTATSIDEAVSQMPLFANQEDPVPEPQETMFGDLPARYYDFRRRISEDAYADARVYYIHVLDDMVLLVQTTGDIAAGDEIAASVTAVEQYR